MSKHQRTRLRTHQIKRAPGSEIFLCDASHVTDLHDFWMISFAAFDGIFIDLRSHVSLHLQAQRLRNTKSQDNDT